MTLPEMQSREITEALPGLLRIAGTSMMRTAQWSLVTGVRTSRRVLAAATDPQSAAELVHDIRLVVEAASDGGPPDREAERSATSGASLRARGEELLGRSRDVRDRESIHPAYDRILDDLLPDEARILVVFLREGAQPSVDVRTTGILGSAGSSLVASHQTMIGERAGVKAPEQVPSYLHNLARLGLVSFSREQLADPLDYQVLEAQPMVQVSGPPARRSRFVRRSIRLTPFGADFCRAAFVDPA